MHLSENGSVKNLLSSTNTRKVYGIKYPKYRVFWFGHVIRQTWKKHNSRDFIGNWE